MIATDSNALPLSYLLTIAGCQCVLRSNSTLIPRTLRRWSTQSSPLVQADCELLIFVNADLRRRSAPPTFRGVRQFVFIAFHGCDQFFFDLSRRRVTAVVSEETAADGMFWNSIMIPIVIGILGPTMNVAPLHSACVAGDGRGMLVAGVSGAGKSTLAVALAQEGMTLISDDWVYARRSDQGVGIHGLGVPVKLMPDTVEFFDDLRRAQPKEALNGELAFEVNPSETLGVCTGDCCEPACIVFLQRHSGASVITRVDRETAREFYRRSAEPLPIELAFVEEKRAEIIHRVTDRDCWLFRNGESPRLGARRLKQFFEETYCADFQRASAS